MNFRARYATALLIKTHINVPVLRHGFSKLKKKKIFSINKSLVQYRYVHQAKLECAFTTLFFLKDGHLTEQNHITKITLPQSSFNTSIQAKILTKPFSNPLDCISVFYVSPSEIHAFQDILKLINFVKLNFFHTIKDLVGGPRYNTDRQIKSSIFILGSL